MTDIPSTIYLSEDTQNVSNEQHAYSDDGVDITLIRWMLSLTPSERLQVLQQNIQSLARLINESSFKEELGQDKDKAVIPILRRTLEEKRKDKD